jgi:alpha-tubulin suppressor-like RCC1 family protein
MEFANRTVLLRLMIVLAVSCVASCGGQKGRAEASVQAVVTLPQSLSAGDVVRVELTVSGAGMTTRTDALVKSGPQWVGILGQLPEGDGRTFRGEALDAAGKVLYAGAATGVRITAAQSTTVALVLQEVGAPAPFENAAPVITSVVASSATVTPGGSVALQASAADANPGDALTSAWTASAGTFSAPSSLATTWTAPGTMGPVVLTLTVTDSKGATATLGLTLTVVPGTGSAAVNVSVNTWPRVTRITATPSAVAVGEATTVSVSASDVDADALSYQWTSSCQGTWTEASTSNPRFTPTAQPPVEGVCARCTLTATVEDGRGGRGTGTLGICVGSTATARFPPEVTETFQSIATVPASGDTVVFRVRAKDPQDSALTFTWTASAGSLGTASSGAVTSEVLWTAPMCIPSGVTPAAEVTVTNALGLSTRATLVLQGGNACVPTHVRRMVANAFGSAALRHDGTVWSWGRNYYGQVGNGTTSSRTVPGPIPDLTGIVAVSMGEDHSLALTPEGTVWGWGGNYSGQMGDGTLTNRLSPFQMPDLTGVAAVAAGGIHSLVLNQDGTVWAWGRNEHGQVGLAATGAVVRPVQVPGLTGVRSIAAGKFHSLALKQDGTVWTWGRNENGELGLGSASHRVYTPTQVPGLTGVAEIVGGYEFSVVLKQDGTVWVWGRNEFGQLGDGTTTSRLSPVQVPGLSDVSSLFVGWAHVIVLKRDGTMWLWGNNADGQFGDGTTTGRLTPTRAQWLSDFFPLASGGMHLYVMKQDGSVWGMGSNGYGQLGDGSNTRRLRPVLLPALSQ